MITPGLPDYCTIVDFSRHIILANALQTDPETDSFALFAHLVSDSEVLFSAARTGFAIPTLVPHFSCKNPCLGAITRARLRVTAVKIRPRNHVVSRRCFDPSNAEQYVRKCGAQMKEIVNFLRAGTQTHADDNLTAVLTCTSGTDR
jgi:hypothetical protein